MVAARGSGTRSSWPSTATGASRATTRCPSRASRENAAATVSATVGSPTAWPANWIFAARHGVAAARYDLLAGVGPVRRPARARRRDRHRRPAAPTRRCWTRGGACAIPAARRSAARWRARAELRGAHPRRRGPRRRGAWPPGPARSPWPSTASPSCRRRSTARSRRGGRGVPRARFRGGLNDVHARRDAGRPGPRGPHRAASAVAARRERRRIRAHVRGRGAPVVVRGHARHQRRAPRQALAPGGGHRILDAGLRHRQQPRPLPRPAGARWASTSPRTRCASAAAAACAAARASVLSLPFGGRDVRPRDLVRRALPPLGRRTTAAAVARAGARARARGPAARARARAEDVVGRPRRGRAVAPSLHARRGRGAPATERGSTCSSSPTRTRCSSPCSRSAARSTASPAATAPTWASCPRPLEAAFRGLLQAEARMVRHVRAAHRRQRPRPGPQAPRGPGTAPGPCWVESRRERARAGRGRAAPRARRRARPRARRRARPSPLPAHARGLGAGADASRSPPPLRRAPPAAARQRGPQPALAAARPRSSRAGCGAWSPAGLGRLLAPPHRPPGGLQLAPGAVRQRAARLHRRPPRRTPTATTTPCSASTAGTWARSTSAT